MRQEAGRDVRPGPLNRRSRIVMQEQGHGEAENRT